MKNEDMKPSRFLKLFEAKTKLAAILGHLAVDGRVVVATPLKATVYTKKHATMFKAHKGSVYVQRGKSWDCIDYCAIRLVA